MNDWDPRRLSQIAESRSDAGALSGTIGLLGRTGEIRW